MRNLAFGVAVAALAVTTAAGQASTGPGDLGPAPPDDIGKQQAVAGTSRADDSDVEGGANRNAGDGARKTSRARDSSIEEVEPAKLSDRAASSTEPKAPVATSARPAGRPEAKRKIRRVPKIRLVDYDRRITEIRGCPPSLARQRGNCTAPKLLSREISDADRAGWWRLPGLQGDGRYRYFRGKLVRLDSEGKIIGYRPLLGGALSPGNAWPGALAPAAVPAYYRSLYGLDENAFRYADGAIYRINPGDSAITGIAALLTREKIIVGRRVPPGFDIYNVPYGYRDRYADGPTGYYRYDDGFIYRINPRTRMVTAAIELLG